MNRTTGAIDRLWAKDLAAALVVGALVGWSPITTANRLVVSIVGGSCAALALLAYRRLVRRRMASGGPASSGTERSGATSSASGGTPSRIFVGACLGLMLLIALPTWNGLLPLYLESVWQNGHGLLLPVMLVAVWLAIRARAGSPADRPSVWAIPVLAVGLAFVVVGVATDALPVAVVGWMLVAAGSTLGLFGPRTLRTYWPVCASMIFFLPLSAAGASPLKLATGSAVVAAELLSAIGIPTHREGSLLFLPNDVLGISPRCSGFSALYAGVAMAFVLAASSASWRRLAWILAALWPLTIFVNGLRSAALLAFGHWQNVNAGLTPVHGLSGLVAFWTLIGCVVLLSTPTARRSFFAAS